MPPSLTPALTLKIYQSRENVLAFNSTKGLAPRYIAPLVEGHLQPHSSSTSPSFNAALVPGGSDWLRVDPSTGTGHLDARLHFRSKTDPSYVFFVRFEGIVRMDEAIQKIWEWSPEAKTTEFGEGRNFVSPVIECSAEENKWMETTVFVGWGRYVVEGQGDERRQAVEYEIFAVGTA
ncbi:hypothetical protein M409DRAFT_51426 [Zasmidium cellare ATCC 36951]|uniref:Uncharacterized protein n=1 Tax=Zasmidium cellare ATCC 36951 TaxID=1080233 RepID=A0A6A6CSZ7_ZASCE|nr:uncharacterized protein M409DRAFT_51426 [Zasmidium cellare ATCC 36951]KAF2170377.1 hypothetical protein M409DRAFT_51426 [Zasmidium cellare ATCC 36951]